MRFQCFTEPLGHIARKGKRTVILTIPECSKAVAPVEQRLRTMIFMKKFTGSVDTVSVIREMLEEGFGVFQSRVIVPSIRILTKAVKAGIVGIDTRPKARPRWPAYRRCTVGIGESGDSW